MSRNIQLYLQDILTSCAKVLRYTQGMSFEEFVADERTFDAAIRNLLVIGEAIKNIPQDMRSAQSANRVEENSGFTGYPSSCLFSGGK